MDSNEIRNSIVSELMESARVKRAVADLLTDEIAEAAHWLAYALGRGGKILLCGNGGSAADAQHIAAELVGRFQIERPGLAAIALSANTASLTAVANDFGFELVFARQVEAFADPGDVVVGLSTSGNSVNVARAIETAKRMGAKTIALTGASGGKLSQIADLVVKVPSSDTPRIQEAHITIGHILCRLVEKKLFGERDDDQDEAAV